MSFVVVIKSDKKFVIYQLTIIKGKPCIWFLAVFCFLQC